MVKEYSEKLTTNGMLFSNPHSRSQSGVYTKNFINSTRQKLLRMFKTNQNEYDIVFVQNASHGFKLLSDCFSFHETSNFCHNSEY